MIGPSLVLATLGAVVPTLVQTTVNDVAHQDFVFAYRLLQKGETVLAIEAFDEFLGKFPRDEKRGDALYFRAMLAHQDGDYVNAATFLENVPAPRVVPGYAVDLLRGQVLTDLQRYEDALRSLEKIPLDALGPMTKASVLYLRGLAYRGAKNLPAAAEALRATVQVEVPLRSRALLDLARVQIQLQEFDDAIETIRQSLTLNDPAVSPEAARIAGDISYQQKHYTQAVEFYRRILTAHQGSPHFAAALEGVLWSDYQAKQYEALLETFETFKSTLTPARLVTAWYLAASAHQELGQHEPALAILEAIRIAAGGTPIQDKVLYKLAASQYELDQIEAMYRTLSRLRQMHPKSAMNNNAVLLLALVDAKQDEAVRGISRLSSLLEKQPDQPVHRQAMWQRAALYEQNQQPEQAIDDYDRYVVIGGSEQRMIHALLRLIDLNYQLHHYDRVRDNTAQLLEKEIDPAVEQEALYRQALALIKLEEVDLALEAIQTLNEKYPQNAYQHEARYYQGLLLLMQEKPDEAVRSLLGAADSEDLDPPLRANALRLAAQHLRNGNERGAADAMLQLEKIVGIENLLPSERFWLGRYLVREKNQPKQGLARLRSLLDSPQVPTKIQIDALLVGGEAWRSLNDFDAAATAFRQVVALGAGSDLAARLELARTLAAAGKTPEALVEYAGLFNAQDPFAVESLYASARIYRDLAVQRKRSSEPSGADSAKKKARKLLKRLVLLYPFASPLVEMSFLELAEIALERGDADGAAGEWADLATKYPDTPYAMYARAMRALQHNKLGEAQFLLHKLGGQKLDDRLTRRVMTQLQELKGTQ